MARKLGQHFLRSEKIAKRIVNSLGITENDIIIEIGPGYGILTKYLIELPSKIIAVEIDKKLCEYLRRRFTSSKLEIVEGDFLKFDISKFKREVKLIGNIPYLLSSPIFEKVLPSSNWSIFVVMLQKEFGERVIASSGKRYSPLSIFTKFYSVGEILFEVKRKHFFPQPDVDSVVVRLIRRDPPSVEVQKFFRIVKIAFQQRRKTIVNSLSKALGIEKEILAKKLQKLHISPGLRPEEIRFQDFLKISDLLK